MNAAAPAPAVVYAFQGALYVNLTQDCPTDCVFCMKRESGRRFHGADLKLETEPSIEEVWRQIAARPRPSEFVFCGYGEPTYRLGAMLELGVRMGLKRPGVPRRLNTIGLGSVVWGRDIVPALRICVDSVSVSLNTADPAQWVRLHRPAPAYRREGFSGVKAFIAACAAAGLRTTVTAVELPGVDLDAVEALASSLGAGFRLRPLLRGKNVAHA